MTSFQWNSLQDLVAIQEKMNRLFEETIHRTEFPDEGVETALWSPAADVYETSEEIILQVEVPGVRLSDVRLEALEGKLRVSGHRRANPDVEPKHFVRMERIYGDFSREFVIPATVDPSKIKASLKAGVLRIVAARSERVEPVSAGGLAPGKSR
jgi:HSP20 family protein